MVNPQVISISQSTKAKDARETLAEHGANELIFAIVGHVGSGTSTVARTLKEILENPALPDGPYDAEIIKASDRIREWASSVEESVPQEVKTLEAVRRLQDLGDKMRELDASAVARELVKVIRLTRAKKQGLSEIPEGPVKPDGKRRAYICES